MSTKRKNRTLAGHDDPIKGLFRQLEDEFPDGGLSRSGELRRARAEELLRRLGGGGALAEFLEGLKGSEFRAVVEFLNILENANHVVVTNKESQPKNDPETRGTQKAAFGKTTLPAVPGENAGPASPDLSKASGPLDLTARMEGFRDELKPLKEAIQATFKRRLKELVGWRAGEEENIALAGALSQEAAECGVRFVFHKGLDRIPVSLAYRNGVFVLTTDGGGYLASSASLMELSVTRRETQSRKKKPRKSPTSEGTAEKTK